MSRDEKILLSILRSRGTMAIYNIDTMFSGSGGKGFAPTVLSKLESKGFVRRNGDRYSITSSGTEALKDAA